jgi:hypothetical protein
LHISKSGISRVIALAMAMLAMAAVYSSSAFAAGAPIVSTGSATERQLSSAVLNGTANGNGAATTYKFEYGLTTSYKNSTSSQSLGSISETLNVSQLIGGLAPETTYHYRISATNAYGTTTGSDQTTTTLAWHVEGKKLSELAHPAETTSEGSSTIKFAFGKTNNPVEFDCKESGHEKLGSAEAIASEITLSGCKAFLNGIESKSCAPKQSILIRLDANFSSVEGILVKMAEPCPLPEEMYFPPTFFTVKAGSESVHLPVTLTELTQFGEHAVTVSLPSTWELASVNAGHNFGIW